MFIIIDQITELPEDGLKSSPETLRYTENKWISRKIKMSLILVRFFPVSILKSVKDAECQR